MKRLLNILFTAGIYISFFGCYFSVSLIGLGTGLVLLAGIILLSSEKKWRQVLENPLFVPLTTLIFVILISIFLAQPYPYEKPLGKVRYLFCFFLFTWYFVPRHDEQNKFNDLIRYIIPVLGITALLEFFGIFSPVKFFGGPPLAPIVESSLSLFHATGFTFHHNPFAAPLVLLFDVCFAHYLFSKDPNKNVKYGISLFFAAVGIFCSFSRSAWLAWAFSAFAILVVKNRRAALKVGGGVALIVILLAAVVSPFRDRLLSIRVSKNPERLELWRIGIEMVKDAPFFGQGFYSFGSRFEKYTDWPKTHPNFPIEIHNMYLDMLSGTGLVGFCAFLFFIFSVFRLLYVLYARGTLEDQDKAWVLGIWGGFISFLIAGIFDKQFYMTQTLVPNFFFLSIAAAIYVRRRQIILRPHLTTLL